MDQGARYFKSDFQVHTPRDLQFTGRAYITDDERAEYSKRFIDNCRLKKIDAVAITDHHDFSFFKHIVKAAVDEKDSFGNEVSIENRIVVFPGLELTLDLPCQALLIFDATLDLTEELIIKIYTALHIQEQAPDEESKSVQHSRLPIKSINEVYEKLNAITSLQNRFTVFPNVKENGGDSILRDGFHNEYSSGVFVGGYLDRGQFEKHKAKIGWNNVVTGKTEAYGYKSIGLFQTSDNRTDTFEHLGVSTTWVKWSTPTAEALRQACLAQNSRISQVEPKLPSTRIKHLKISGSSFLKEMEIEFNPQFNVLIGGRGTGKSSVLQYISWALGKDNLSEKKLELETFIKNTLPTGFIEISIVKNGILHIIRRSLNLYQIKIGNEECQNTNSQNIVAIIRTDTFSQKELSKHEKDKISQLTHIIENAVSEDVESIKRQLNENSNKIKEVSASYETYLSNLRSSEDLKTQIDSIEEQMKGLDEKLTDIPTEDQTIIKNNNLIENEKDIVKQSQNQINNIISQINSILEKGNFNLSVVDLSNVKNSEEIQNLTSAHNNIIKNLKEELESTLNNADSEDFNNQKEIINALHQEHDKEYVQAKGRQINFEQIIQQLEELRQKLALLIQDRARILETLDLEKGTKKQLQRLFFNRNTLNEELYKKINSAVSDIVNKSEGSLEIHLNELENIDEIFELFQKEVTSSKGQPQRTQAFFNILKKGNLTYKYLLKLWLAIYKSKLSGSKIDDVLAEFNIVNSTLLDTDFDRIVESLSTSAILDLSLKLPTYDLKLLYCKDQNNKIPFEVASYGQQAGSILTILLNQEFGPLLIDQPEDDLDNKVIHQITENIISSKHNRQLIFSSHIANIAVNGDAELILTFDHNSDKSAGEIIASGSIDQIEIKEHVKDIMEGGKKAFDLRKVKYGF